MKKIFIYYSLTGNGDFIASYLKQKKYDLKNIEVQKNLPNNFLLRIIIGGFKSMIKYRDKIINFDVDINSYDEIVVGSPIWNDRVCSPIYSLLNDFDFSNKKLSFILYSGSGKSTKALDYINNIFPNSKVFLLKEPLKNDNEIKKINSIYN